jgi:hypothetical protein
MVCDGESDPVLPKVWTETEDGVPCLDESIEGPELGLEMGGIAQDVEVVLGKTALFMCSV